MAEVFNDSVKFSKKEEEIRATTILKTRICPVWQAQVFMNQSTIFRAPAYKMARVLITKWAALERKMHRLRILSPWDHVEMAIECQTLLEYSKFQSPTNRYWIELVMLI